MHQILAARDSTEKHYVSALAHNDSALFYNSDNGSRLERLTNLSDRADILKKMNHFPQAMQVNANELLRTIMGD